MYEVCWDHWSWIPWYALPVQATLVEGSSLVVWLSVFGRLALFVQSGGEECKARVLPAALHTHTHAYIYACSRT